MTPPTLSDVGILTESELTALERSSGDDCDMASVQCVVRELRAARESNEQLRKRLAELEPDAETVEALGVVYGMLNGTILKADGHSRRVARAYLDRVVKWEEG